MKILTKYLLKTVVSGCLLVLFVLMGAELLIGFIGQLGDIGEGNYGLAQAFRFALLDMPYQISLFFPMAGLIGSLLSLGMLANQNELIVMRAAGLSTLQILSSIILAAFLMTMIAMGLGEVIAPYAEELAHSGKALARTGSNILSTKQGIWIREGFKFIHIDKIADKNKLVGITSYQFSPSYQLEQVTAANEANYLNSQWWLKQVKISTLHSTRVITSQLAESNWQIALDPNLLPSLQLAANKEPRSISLFKLSSYIHYLKENHSHSAPYELNFWKRVMQPIATLVMIALAVPFVLGSVRNFPIGMRVVIGIVIGFTFYLLNQFFGPLSLLYQLPPLLAATLPTLVFMLAGVYFLRRVG